MLGMGWSQLGHLPVPGRSSISSQHMLQNQESRDVLTSFLLQPLQLQLLITDSRLFLGI